METSASFEARSAPSPYPANIRSILRDELTKEIIKLVFAILLAVLLLRLGLKENRGSIVNLHGHFFTLVEKCFSKRRTRQQVRRQIRRVRLCAYHAF
jgi:hypothetical protein